MGGTSKKIETLLPAKDLEALLKSLATGLRNVAAAPGLKELAQELAQCAKLEISLKRMGELAELKVKAKGPGLAVETGDLAAPSFKSLKKRMKSGFKAIVHSLEAGALPLAEVVDMFLKDSETMCGHPQRGVQDYAPYAALCAQFKDAFARKDIEALSALAVQLNAGKKACHAVAK